MRSLIILANAHYVTSDSPKLNDKGEYVGSLAVGGKVRVPKENVVGVVVYTDSQIEAFRHHLHKLENRDNPPLRMS